MSAERVGRNDPCPCGSGKKYKKCCLERDRQALASRKAQAVAEALREAMEGHGFDSLEAMQAFADEFMAQRNRAPVDDFQGLSPEQMSQLLYEPWTSPSLLSFADPLPVEPDAPIVRLFTLLADAIGEGGVKPTAKGNLPRKLCREIAVAYFGEDRYRENTRYGGINREDDFYDLNVTRLVAEMAGLIRKYKGRFILSQECRRLMKGEGMRAIYPRLFKVHVEEFNWAYGDGYAEVPFIQHAFAFTLYLLARYGETARPESFYEDAFLQAFPAVTQEVEPAPYRTAEDIIRRCYAIRTLSRFAEFTGLVEREAVKSEKAFATDYMVRKLPLLEHVVRFSS